LSLYKKVTSHGGEYIEATVLGNAEVASRAALQVIVGSSKEQFEKFKKVFSLWGTPRYVGEVGAATRTKLALNNILGSNFAAFASSYGYLASSGVDTEMFETILSNGPFGTNYPYYKTWSKKIQNRNYTNVASSLDCIHKDIGLFLDQAKQAGIDTTQIEGTYQLYAAAKSKIDKIDNQPLDFTVVYEQIAKKDK